MARRRPRPGGEVALRLIGSPERAASGRELSIYQQVEALLSQLGGDGNEAAPGEISQLPRGLDVGSPSPPDIVPVTIPPLAGRRKR